MMCDLKYYGGKIETILYNNIIMGNIFQLTNVYLKEVKLLCRFYDNY